MYIFNKMAQNKYPHTKMNKYENSKNIIRPTESQNPGLQMLYPRVSCLIWETCCDDAQANRVSPYAYTFLQLHGFSLFWLFLLFLVFLSRKIHVPSIFNNLGFSLNFWVHASSFTYESLGDQLRVSYPCHIWFEVSDSGPSLKFPWKCPWPSLY